MKKFRLLAAIIACSNFLYLQTLSHNIYVVALAGGAGERLWPLSKKDIPKQFLSLNGTQTMLEDTLDRLQQIPSVSELWAVTTQELAHKVRNYSGKRLHTMVIEPDRRDTAPAILLTCLKIAERDPDGVVIFVPTDHYIQNTQRFAELMHQAIQHTASSNDITLLGITPSYPATNYGYICYDEEKRENNVAPLLAFYEKPDEIKAQHYFEQKNFLWNSGIYCAKVKCLLEAYKTYAPEIYNATTAYVQGTATYDKNPKISIDYAITEKYPHRAVILADLIWSDVGDLKTFLSLCTNKIHKLITLNADDNLVHSKKLVVLVGVKQLCLIETDDEIIVIPQDQLNLIRAIISILKEHSEYQNHV